MRIYIRYYRGKNGLPRGTMVAMWEPDMEGGYWVRCGWSFCHKKDMRLGMFSKRAGRAYAFERMLNKQRSDSLRDGNGRIVPPREMQESYRCFRNDACKHLVERMENAKRKIGD